MLINITFAMKADASSRNQILIDTERKMFLYTGSPVTESGDLRIDKVGRSQAKSIVNSLRHANYKESKSYPFEEDIVYVTCYGKRSKFTRNDAIKEFKLAFAMSDGCERERYANILYDLEAGRTECSDGDNV